mmetsp:Transcript_14755/g.24608  ORF Transcript_14755/g.24608 Transcript_14755/m.24608 type:complete len:107 (+) Transcript_14755:65-385(+)
MDLHVLGWVQLLGEIVDVVVLESLTTLWRLLLGEYVLLVQHVLDQRRLEILHPVAFVDQHCQGMSLLTCIACGCKATCTSQPPPRRTPSYSPPSETTAAVHSMPAT